MSRGRRSIVKHRTVPISIKGRRVRRETAGKCTRARPRSSPSISTPESVVKRSCFLRQSFPTTAMIKPFASQLAQHLSDTHALWPARLLDGHPYSEASYHLSYLKMLSVKGKAGREWNDRTGSFQFFLLTTTRLVSRSFASVRVRPEAVWLLSPFLGLQTSADVLTMKTAESYNAAAHVDDAKEKVL